MNNRKGFTLVELLVVVVILGIITGLSIPLIRNIQNSNENKEYNTYRNSIEYSAKLYVDSYGEDLFGRHKTGCALIRYQDLMDKGLLKDIPVDKVSCNSGETYVKVVKIDNKYSYVSSIGCGSVGADGKVKIDTKLPKEGIPNSDTCSVDAKTIMSFTAAPSADSSIKYKKRNVKLTISSNTGINNNMNIYYGYSYNRDSNVINNDWKKLPVTVPGKKSQKEDILSGKAINITTDNLTTPNNVTGELYLVIQIEKLENVSEESWTTDPAQDKFLYFGPYTVDNTKPQFNDSTVVSSESGFNSTKPKLQLKVTDEKYSSANDLRMCISYDSDTCSTKVADMKDNSKYERYDANKVLPNISGSYNSSSHTIYVTVADAAGNYAKKSFSYRVARRWTLTYDANGGNACNPTTKVFTYNDWETNLTWGDLCTPTRNSYIFLGWNTNADGSGTDVTKDTPVNGDLTVYGKWQQPYKYIGHVFFLKNDPCRIPMVTIDDYVTNIRKSHMNSCGLVVAANRFTHPPKDYSGFGLLTSYPNKWGLYANEANIYYTLNAPTSDVSQMRPLSVYEWSIRDRINMYIYKIEPVQTPPGMEFVGEVHTITTYIDHGNWAQWSSGVMMIDAIKNTKKTDWGCYGTSQPITRGLNYTGFGVILTGGERSYDAKCGYGNYKLYGTANNMYYSPVATTDESRLTPLTSTGVTWLHKENRKYYVYRKKA